MHHADHPPGEPVRIAMWSGPRNISTAMMRSWGARADTFVCDEPLYAHYLKQTGLRHPGAAEIIAHHEGAWPKVVAWLTGPIPEGRSIFYQKHMAHHLLPEIDLGWLEHVVNCFLVREPREMITSLAKVTPSPTLEDTGLPQQIRLFQLVRERTGCVPPVLDSKDVLTDPAGKLAQLCAAVGVPFTEDMLRWASGGRSTDGIWAPHWYDSVERSTGFAPYRPKEEPVPEHLKPLAGSCDDLYAELHQHRI